MARKKKKKSSGMLGTGFKVYIPKARKVPVPFKPKGREERITFESVREAKKAGSKEFDKAEFKDKRKKKVVQEAVERGRRQQTFSGRAGLFAEKVDRTTEKVARAVVTGQSKGAPQAAQKFKRLRKIYTKGINTRRLQM